MAPRDDKPPRQEGEQPVARLHPDDLRQLAREVAKELRDDDLATPGRMVDANELARLLSVTPRWVREHAALLGGERLPGSGEAPRWRFDPARARAALAAGRTAPRAPTPVPRRARRRKRPSTPLLPVREDD
jgi:hypothetical protein